MILRHYTTGSICATSDDTLLDAWDDPCMWYCVVCGVVYAQASVEGPAKRERMWVAHRGCCESCKPPECFYNWVPGSLWSYEEKRNNYLPEEILQRELLLTIKAMEAFIND